MKKLTVLLFFIIFFVVFSFFATSKAYAKARIPVCFPCEAIDVVEELPDEEALNQGGSYLDLGYLHEEYGILFISFWNTNGKYVLTNEDKTTYYDISEEQLQELAKTYNVDVDGNPLGLWKKLGGKIILLIVIGIGIFVAFQKESEEDKAKSM